MPLNNMHSSKKDGHEMVLCCYCEAYFCLRLGCRWVHLSTHDKQQFYSHLGYSNGPLVSPLRKCVSQLSSEQVTANIICWLHGQ